MSTLSREGKQQKAEKGVEGGRGQKRGPEDGRGGMGRREGTRRRRRHGDKGGEVWMGCERCKE